MSDSRRRRRSSQSCGSDDLSDSYEDLNATKGTQSSEHINEHPDSEGEVYTSDFEFESQDGAQRESGDGQEEEKPEKKLDDDEDRRNPQYIPKRGTFYEHDDRTTDEITETKTETPNERESKEKKVWKDKEDRWDHDRYNDEEQAPKSHEELIAVYGYDIRNEEGPPRARRRRRYGRGPNKYTRNWEDEDAYGKTMPAAKGQRKFNRSGEEFPALGTTKNSPGSAEKPVISSAWYSTKNKTESKAQNFPPLQSQVNSPKAKSSAIPGPHTNENKAPNESANLSWKRDGKHPSHNQNRNGDSGSGDTERIINSKMSPRDMNKRAVQESVTLAASRVRGRGFKMSPNNNTVSNRTVENKPKGRGAGLMNPENRRTIVSENSDDQHQAYDVKHNSNTDNTQYHQTGRHTKNFYNQASSQQRPNTGTPRMQQQQQVPSQSQAQPAQPPAQQPQPQDGTGNRPKRYSSLRQRPPIAESTGQQNYPPQHTQHSQHGQHGQHGYFQPQAGNTRGVLESPGYPQGHFEPPAPVPAAVGAVAAVTAVGATAAPMAGQPVIPISPNGQPASYAPPPFLVPPPQFIAPQTAPPSIINYVPGPNGPAFQPNFQGYQGYTPPVQPQRPPPTQELYQPQGCTYYSPAQQQQQSVPPRRPKAAIPILPPPDNQQNQIGKGKGRITQQQQLNSHSDSGEQPEQEDKSNLEEDSEKIVSEQFENAESEDLIEPEIEKDEEVSAIIIDDTVKDEEINVEDIIVEEVNEEDIEAPVNVEHIIIEDVKEEDNVSNSSDVIVNEQNLNSSKSTQIVVTQTETELNKIETATSESAIVEEMAA